MAKALGKNGRLQLFHAPRGAATRTSSIPSIGLMRGQGLARQLADAVQSARLPGRQHEQRFHRGHELAILLVRAAGRAGPDRADGRTEKFAAKLDELFTFKNTEAKGLDDVQGRHRRILARQRTEPSHHLSLLLRRPALEGGRAAARGGEDANTATSPTRSAATTTAARCRPGTCSPRWASIRSARRATIT